MLRQFLYLKYCSKSVFATAKATFGDTFRMAKRYCNADNIFTMYFLTKSPNRDKFILAGVFIMNGALASRVHI